jgi:integrase
MTARPPPHLGSGHSGGGSSCIENGLPRPLDGENDAERKALLEYFQAQRPQYYPLVHLLFWTGLRISEALGLFWGDVDFERGTLSVRRSRTNGELNATKTRRSTRTIHLPDAVVEVLRKYRGDRVPAADEPLWLNARGRPLDQHCWRKDHWAGARKATGVRRLPAYNTRHTFITHALLNGWLPHEVALYCGTSITMIEMHYAGLLAEPLEAKLERLSVAAGGNASPDAVVERFHRTPRPTG